MRDDQYGPMYELEEHLWWFAGMRAITASLLDGLLKQDQRVLDVGCGTGYSMVWLQEKFGLREVFGVDVSTQAAAFCKARSLERVACASADRLPFADGSFDLVTCFDVIYQLNDERASAAVNEASRVLRPGGLFFIREPAYQWLRGAHDRAVGTRRRYTLTDLRRLLRARGFKIKRATYANALLIWLAAPHRLLSKWRGGTDSDVKPVPGWLNSTFGATLKLEARILRRRSFPFGLSAVILAEKESR